MLSFVIITEEYAVRMISMKKRNMLQKKRVVSFLAFVLPAFILICITSLIPFLMNIYYSLTSWNGIDPEKNFVGLRNFVTLFQEKDFWTGPVVFTFKYAICYVILANIIALGMALLLVIKFKLANLLRAMFYIPNIISLVMVGYVWKFIFGMGFQDLYEKTGWEIFQLSWLGDSKLVFWSLLFVSLWQVVGFYCVIYIAGLQGVPDDVIEAATIDGAGRISKFFRITLPLIVPSITVCLFTSLLNALKVFDLPFVLTSGGPGGATTSISMDIYNEAFFNNLYGYGTAKSLVFFVIIVVITMFQLKMTKSREVEV